MSTTFLNTAPTIGAAHPLREALHNEVHARPTEPMRAPLMLSHVASVGGAPSAIRSHLCALLANRHLPIPSETDSYITADIGGVHLRWEQHTEFHTYTFSRPLGRDAGRGDGHGIGRHDGAPIDAAPQDWLRGLSGQWLVGMHVMVVLDEAAGRASGDVLDNTSGDVASRIPGDASDNDVSRSISGNVASRIRGNAAGDAPGNTPGGIPEDASGRAPVNPTPSPPLPQSSPPPLPPAAHGWLDQATLVASSVFRGAATVYTDFRLHADGFGRWVIVTRALDGVQLGRLVQCVLEIETYRMMALLGLPAAREVGRCLATAERDLADVAEHIQHAKEDDESELLRQLTRLAAQVEGLYARTHARFSASTAYFDLVQQRIEELGEGQVADLKTLGQFMERRLHPAMQTCQWAARRQQALSERISRVSNMLRTRVDIAQQQSSEALLDAMNRRQQAQLLLQAAVEGLSVAAVTYYGVGLIEHLADGLHALGIALPTKLIAALAVPVIALGVWLGVRRLHHRIQDAAQ